MKQNKVFLVKICPVNLLMWRDRDGDGDRESEKETEGEIKRKRERERQGENTFQMLVK